MLKSILKCTGSQWREARTRQTCSSILYQLQVRKGVLTNTDIKNIMRQVATVPSNNTNTDWEKNCDHCTSSSPLSWLRNSRRISQEDNTTPQFDFCDLFTCRIHNSQHPNTCSHPPEHLTQTYPPFCLNHPLRLHLEQAGCSPDAALWERLHCDEGASRSSRGCHPVQIPLREA